MIESPDAVRASAQRAWEATNTFLGANGVALAPMCHGVDPTADAHYPQVTGDADSWTAVMTLWHPRDCGCEFRN